MTLLVTAPLAHGEIQYHVTDLSEFVGANRTARAINEAGQVVGGPAGGSAFLPAPGYLWDPENGVTLLQNASPLHYVGANGLNDSGHVVGVVVGAVLGVVQHAFVWQEDSGIVDIGTLNATTNNLAQAYDINDAGLVVGSARDLFGTASQAFVWESGQGDLLPLAEFAAAFSSITLGRLPAKGSIPRQTTI